MCLNPSTKLGKVIPIFNFIPLFFQQNESCPSIRQNSTEGVRRKSFTIDKKFPENPVVK